MSAETEATRPRVLPVYILVDVSFSMDGEPIEAVNEIVPALVDACREYTTLADMLRFSLITFSSDAKTRVPMTSYTDSIIPELDVEGATSYSAGFAEVTRRLDTDVESLKSDGYAVLRPSVFFVTDGAPTDGQAERDRAWSDLVDENRRAHPNVLAFGIGGEVVGAALKQYVAHKGRAFVSRTGSDAATSLRSIIEMLVMSVVASANNASDGSNSGLVLNTEAIDEDMDEIV